jgi:prepilin-type processing-associated H-X9-DG protein
MALMMKGMSGGGPQGTLIRDGDVVFLVSRGAVEKLSVAKMERLGRVNYRQLDKAKVEQLKALIAPVIGKEKLQQGGEQLLDLMMDPEADMGQLLPLLMMMGGDKGGGDMMGMLFFTRLTSEGSKTPPTCSREGDTLLILDRGVLYKINTAKMELEGRVDCRPNAGKGPEQLMKALEPALAEAREQAMQTACVANLKQMGLAALMFAQDHDETLPGETWVKDLWDYAKNPDIFRCPKRPDAGQEGYVLNKAAAGHKLGDFGEPAETVLMFEGTPLAGKPLGGADRLPPEGVHNGGINACFVDGHVKWMKVEEAKGLLERPR